MAHGKENPETNLVDVFIELANIYTSEYEVILNTGLSYLSEDEAENLAIGVLANAADTENTLMFLEYL